MKYERGWFFGRIRGLIYKALSMSFLTWVAVSYMYFQNKQELDIAYLAFTATVIGLKSYFKNKGGEQ